MGALGTKQQKQQKQTAYSLRISENQARVIVAALDLYMRLGMGQVSKLMDLPDWRVSPEVADSLRAVKRQVFPDLLDGNYFSISSPEIHRSNRTAYDLEQVIRHRLAWDKAGNPKKRDWLLMFGVDYDEPMQYDPSEPLAIITREES